MAGDRYILCLALLAFSPAAHADFATPITPPGVTLQPVVHASAMEAGRASKTTAGSFTDANGMTLYIYEGDAVLGRSSCVDKCAEERPPLAAPANATPAGDWSVVDRRDGTRQWAYKTKPLYRSALDAKPGDMNGVGTDGVWRMATFEQAPDEIPTPAAITLKPVPNANGEVFVDYRGMTLYVFDGDVAPGKSACVDACLKTWPPVLAGELAKPLGDWTLVRRDDGARQWAYKGKPLYTYGGDRKPGDANGAYVDKQWRAAAVRRHFMPPEVIGRINGGWTVLTTAEGMTLYARDKFRFSFGSYSVNDGPPPTPAVGRSIGPSGCDAACLAEWKPLKASADAQPSGYWSIVARADGDRQWAYQGYPLYTFAQDKKPGDMLGRDLFSLTDGANAMYWRLAMP